jgi:uncharacterized membrane protein YcaP (DUF421 family)
MEHLLSVDWAAFFIPRHSLLDMAARGSAMYLGLFLFLRVMGRRQGGSISTADVLVIVLLADAAQNGMAHEYQSVTEGFALVLTILFWDFAIDWLSFHVPALRPLLNPPALCLIKNGVLQRRNMRKELVTLDEIMAHLREQGIESLEEVRVAQIEEDGNISVVKRSAKA